VLKHAALRVAAAQGLVGLDLTGIQASAAGPLMLPDKTVQSGHRVVLIGAEDLRIISVVARLAGLNGRVEIIESERGWRDRATVAAADVENQLGYRNWTIAPAELDDLRTDPDFVTAILQDHPVVDLESHRSLQASLARQRSTTPLIPDASVDVVILNGAVNRLPLARIPSLLAESMRVVRRGGRLVLIVLLADEPPRSLDALSGRPALSYVPQEREVFALLADAGFHGMEYVSRAELPATVVAGVELRRHVVLASKGKEGICLDRGRAVIYRGPWREVLDDDNHRFVRGERTAVCEKTLELLMRPPYQGEFFEVPCYLEIPADAAIPFDCNTPQLRDPQVTKGRKTLAESRTACTTPADGKCCS
jgi:arsenite methyltransferase